MAKVVLLFLTFVCLIQLGISKDILSDQNYASLIDVLAHNDFEDPYLLYKIFIPDLKTANEIQHYLQVSVYLKLINATTIPGDAFFYVRESYETIFVQYVEIVVRATPIFIDEYGESKENVFESK